VRINLGVVVALRDPKGGRIEPGIKKSARCCQRRDVVGKSFWGKGGKNLAKERWEEELPPKKQNAPFSGHRTGKERKKTVTEEKSTKRLQGRINRRKNGPASHTMGGEHSARRDGGESWGLEIKVKGPEGETIISPHEKGGHCICHFYRKKRTPIRVHQKGNERGGGQRGPTRRWKMGKKGAENEANSPFPRGVRNKYNIDWENGINWVQR